MSIRTARFDAPTRRLFLQHLAVAGNASAAAACVSLSLSTVRQHYRDDPAFKQQWDDVMALAGGTLEAAVLRRALEGVPRKLYHNGKPVVDPGTGLQAVEVDYNAARELALLKRFLPEEYRERVDNRLSRGVDQVPDDELIARVKRVIEDREMRPEPVEDAPAAFDGEAYL